MTFDPYSLDNTPSIGVYQILALFGTLQRLYCPAQTDRGYLPHSLFPATYFPQRNVGKGNTWTWDNEENSVEGSDGEALYNLIVNLNDGNMKEVNYLLSGPDGIWFDGRLRTVTFPLNIVNVIQCKYRTAGGLPSQWYGQIQTIPISSLPTIDYKNIPEYLKAYQVNESSLGELQRSTVTRGYNDIVPLVSKDTEPLWVAFTQLLVDQPNVVKSLNIFSNGSLSV